MHSGKHIVTLSNRFMLMEPEAIDNAKQHNSWFGTAPKERNIFSNSFPLSLPLFSNEQWMNAMFGILKSIQTSASFNK